MAVMSSVGNALQALGRVVVRTRDVYLAVVLLLAMVVLVKA